MNDDLGRGEVRGHLSSRRKSADNGRGWNAALGRYRPAALRYLSVALGNPASADRLYNHFARLLLDGLEPWNPQPGRFRDVMRTALVRLVEEHRSSISERNSPPSGLDDDAEGDRDEAARFDAIWREELLKQTWRRLEALEAESGVPLHSALRRKSEAPGLTVPKLAECLGQELGRPISPELAKTLLRRARAEFSQALLEEVVATMPAEASFEAIERELIETGLLAFCREAFGRVRSGGRRG